MRKWKIYFSGLDYGTVYFEQGRMYHECLNVFTGKYEEKQPLAPEQKQEFFDLLPIDWEVFAQRIDSYEAALANTPAEVIMPTGERYQKSGENMYIQREVKFPKNLITADSKIVGVVVPAREKIGVLIDPAYEELTIIPQWKTEYPQEEIAPVEHLGTFDVVTRDGEKLSTDVFLPANRRGALPTVLVRTPYGKEHAHRQYYRFVQRGYAVVIQDVRGREGSSGQWVPNHFEVEDGDDTLNWIAAQPWSNKKVGMIGGSYLGYVQWAAAASGNPYLAAMVSVVCAGSPFVDLPRRGGCFASGVLAWSFYVSKQVGNPALMARDDWDEVLDIRPIQDIPNKVLGYDIPFIQEWLSHKDYDQFWYESDWVARSKGMQVPALIQSGWFDDNGMGTTEAIKLTQNYPAGNRKIILGPWAHSGNAHYDLHGLALGDKALRFDIDLLHFKWFDHFLKGKENGIEKGAPVEYYTVEENRWKTAESWPVPQTKEVEFYLTSQGGANTSSGNGALVLEKVDTEGKDTLAYDPKDPATCLIDMSENEIEMPGDYTQEEQRQDYLCYTTAPLEKNLVITGDFAVELYVSSDAPDTDFIVRITDVDENGRSVKLADGILGARYRNGFTKSEMMKAGEVYRLNITTTKISHLFRQGHQLRFTVTSSAKNFVFPNSNTEKGYNSPVVQVAHNSVHHGGRYASKVVARVEL